MQKLLYGEEYVLGFEVFSRDDGYLEWGTVVIKAGDRPAPLDVSVDVLKNGDFIIFSADNQQILIRLHTYRIVSWYRAFILNQNSLCSGEMFW